VWLLFENEDGRFPLYPGETAWISYVYTVKGRKWGPWWQRAIRLPTRRLSMTLALPTRLQPSVWGMETSMTAESTPFRTPISRQEKDGQVVFTWSADEPPLHARYRIEWKFRVPDDEGAAQVKAISPAQRMRALDIAQEGDSVLAEVARPFDLPTEAEDARRVVTQLVSTLERVGQVHHFSKGMGLAAPQIRIGRAAAVVRTPGGETVTLLNPRICDESAETDEQYEDCLSWLPVSSGPSHAGLAGCIGITTLDITMITGVMLAAPAMTWVIVGGAAASRR
jgi:hypothetical protein